MNTTSLRELLDQDRFILAPGAYDCLTAKLVEIVGFPAIYMTGAGTSFAKHGYPDVGLITMTEMVQNAEALAKAVSIPIIADADTGYGNVLNVRRTVQEFEHAGVAAIHIEDQSFPKRCGHFDNKSIISENEMVEKVRAAVESRTDDDFLIIARTDAITVNGIDSALARASAYEAAGADIIFVESPRSMAEIGAIPPALSGPVMFNMVEGKSPYMNAEDLERLGYRIAIVPGTHRVIIPAVQAYLKHLAGTGEYASYSGDMLSFEAWKEMVGLKQVEELELRHMTGS